MSRPVRDPALPAKVIAASHPTKEEMSLELGLLIYDTIGDLLSAVRAQLQVTSNEEWLEKQTAGELAQLMGVEVDRVIQLLAGLRPAADNEAPQRRTDTGRTA